MFTYAKDQLRIPRLLSTEDVSYFPHKFAISAYVAFFYTASEEMRKSVAHPPVPRSRSPKTERVLEDSQSISISGAFLLEGCVVWSKYSLQVSMSSRVSSALRGMGLVQRYEISIIDPAGVKLAYALKRQGMSDISVSFTPTIAGEHRVIVRDVILRSEVINNSFMVLELSVDPQASRSKEVFVSPSARPPVPPPKPSRISHKAGSEIRPPATAASQPPSRIRRNMTNSAFVREGEAQQMNKPRGLTHAGNIPARMKREGPLPALPPLASFPKKEIPLTSSPALPPLPRASAFGDRTRERPSVTPPPPGQGVPLFSAASSPAVPSLPKSDDGPADSPHLANGPPRRTHRLAPRLESKEQEEGIMFVAPFAHRRSVRKSRMSMRFQQPIQKKNVSQAPAGTVKAVIRVHLDDVLCSWNVAEEGITYIDIPKPAGDLDVRTLRSILRKRVLDSILQTDADKLPDVSHVMDQISKFMVSCEDVAAG